MSQEGVDNRQEMNRKLDDLGQVLALTGGDLAARETEVNTIRRAIRDGVTDKDLLNSAVDKLVTDILSSAKAMSQEVDVSSLGDLTTPLRHLP